MAEGPVIGLELTITSIDVHVWYWVINWKLKGPPGEWFQIYYRAKEPDEEWVYDETWVSIRQGNFNTEGAATGMVELKRPDYDGKKIQIMAIGENDVFSNDVKIPPLIPTEDQPPTPPELKYCCPYCKKCFATKEELIVHIDTEHIPQEQGTQAAGEVTKVAEALDYDSYIDSIAQRMGMSGYQVTGKPRVDIDERFSTERLGTGKTLQEIIDSCDKAAWEANSKYHTLVAAAMVSELIPWIDVGSASLHAMSAPRWGAGNRMATDYFYSGYRYATDPILQRYWFSKETPLLPEAYRLSLAASKGILTDAKYKEAMAQSGLNAEWADMWVKQNYLYPDFGQITNMYWRKLLDEKTYEPLMRLAGYRKEDIGKLKKLTEIIPPLTDLITMAVREAFGDHTYEKQMPALVDWGAKQGLSEEWVKNYWYAHWDRIPLTQMYANLWRGYWDKDAFDRMLRIKDVHPDDRKAILDVAYLPPSIRELGYGYDFQRYNRDDIVRYRRWGGLNKEDAEKAADALIDYRTSAEWEAIRREFLWRFAHEMDTEEEYRNFLAWTGLQPYVIDLWVYRGWIQQDRYKVPDTAIEYRIVTSSEALWAFKNNLKDEKWLRATLENLNWDKTRVDLAVERALYEKAMKEDIPDIIKTKTLTISQLKSLYNAQLISIDLLAQRLQTELHYTPEDAAMLAKTFVTPPVEPEPAPEPRKLTLAQLKQLYEAQVINKAQLIVEMVDSLNYDINDASAIADLYTPKFEPEVVVPEEKVIYTKPYSDAWSRRLYAQRLLMGSQVYSNYLALGYVPKQAEKLTISMLIDDVYPMITAQYSKGLINEEQFMQVLVDIGMEGWQAIELMDRTIRDYQVDRLDDERKLTKAEIIKGLKKEVITIDQTVELLTDIGYEYWEAYYIVNLELVVAAGDPETFWDMKKVTEAYKRALNRNSKIIPEEVLMLDKKLKKLKQELEELKKADADEKTIAKKVVEIGDVEARLRKVIVLKKLY